MVRLAPRATSAALTRAQAFLHPEDLRLDLGRMLDHRNQVGGTPCNRSRDSVLR
jgi:hypothetical protein